MADNISTIKCPACNKVMAKVYIESRGINLDICLDGCGGIYFDNREFNYFNEQTESIDEIEKALAEKTFEPVDETVERYCPVCGSKMVKNYSAADKEITVDDCYNCGGKFLDCNKLQKIRAKYATDDEKSKDFMRILYRTIGKELIEFEAKHEKLSSGRSSLRKSFDKLRGL